MGDQGKRRRTGLGRLRGPVVVGAVGAGVALTSCSSSSADAPAIPVKSAQATAAPSFAPGFSAAPNGAANVTDAVKKLRAVRRGNLYQLRDLVLLGANGKPGTEVVGHIALGVADAVRFSGSDKTSCAATAVVQRFGPNDEPGRYVPREFLLMTPSELDEFTRRAMAPEFIGIPGSRQASPAQSRSFASIPFEHVAPKPAGNTETTTEYYFAVVPWTVDVGKNGLSHIEPAWAVAPVAVQLFTQQLPTAQRFWMSGVPEKNIATCKPDPAQTPPAPLPPVTKDGDGLALHWSADRFVQDAKVTPTGKGSGCALDFGAPSGWDVRVKVNGKRVTDPARHVGVHLRRSGGVTASFERSDGARSTTLQFDVSIADGRASLTPRGLAGPSLAC